MEFRLPIPKSFRDSIFPNGMHKPNKSNWTISTPSKSKSRSAQKSWPTMQGGPKP